jgi:hypothetical protein
MHKLGVKNVDLGVAPVVKVVEMEIIKTQLTTLLNENRQNTVQLKQDDVEISSMGRFLYELSQLNWSSGRDLYLQLAHLGTVERTQVFSQLFSSLYGYDFTFRSGVFYDRKGAARGSDYNKVLRKYIDRLFDYVDDGKAETENSAFEKFLKRLRKLLAKKNKFEEEFENETEQGSDEKKHPSSDTLCQTKQKITVD